MGKNNNKKTPAVEAPVVEAKQVEEVGGKSATATIVDMAAGKGLTQSEKLQFATELRHRVSELREEDNPPLEMIKGYNMIRDITFIDLAAGEIACGTSATGFIFSGNEVAYKALCGLALTMGVKMPDFKTLPAPTKEQLHNAGLEGIGETKYVAIESKDVSKETKERKKKERKLNDEAEKADKAYLTDHTKIETPEQLGEALGFQLVNLKVASPVERLITAAQFYRSYLEARAEKSDNPEAEVAKIHENSLADLLQDISTMVPPTFAIEGFGKHLCKLAESNGSIIPAFNLFRKASINKTTGKCKFSDEECAVLVRVIIVWNASAQIASISKDIKLLNKDAKANAKAIEQCTAKIQHQQDIISLASEPDFDIADNFIAAYKDNEHAKHNLAVALYNSIISTYYPDADIPELEVDTALLNVQQRIGIIINLFNSELGKRDDYSEENLIAFSTEDEKPKEGEGSKNS
jgi:hypothetical protein